MGDLAKLDDRTQIWGEGTLVEAPVRSVVVMEDRAQVTRRASIDLPAGTVSIIATPVTPLVADRSLRCRIRPVSPGAGAGEPPRVLDVRVRRHFLVRAARPEREQELTRAVEQIEDEFLRVYDRMCSLFHERELAGEALKNLAQYIGDRLVVGCFDSHCAEEIEQCFSRRAELEQQLLSGQWEQDDRTLRLRQIEQELRLAIQPVSEYRAALISEFRVPEPGKYALEWDYQVPCALWRPIYAAELTEQDGTYALRWQSAGMVWQASGEDWIDVQLEFSTARPALAAELPLLDDDVLEARDKTEEEKRVIEVASRDQGIARTGTVPQPAESETPPGLDDGGEARSYKVPERVSIASDARPHRVLFEAWSGSAECEYVCAAEKAEHVFLRSLQSNPSRLPLLAGPVLLTRNGGLIGYSQIRFVAGGERFELSWGSEDGIAVSRDVERTTDQTAIRKRRTYTYQVRTFLANHSSEPRTVRVIERVPVSEIDPVEVELLAAETTPGFEKDANGLLTWKLELQPSADRRVDVAFRLGMPQNVVWKQ